MVKEGETTQLLLQQSGEGLCLNGSYKSKEIQVIRAPQVLQQVKGGKSWSVTWSAASC